MADWLPQEVEPHTLDELDWWRPKQLEERVGVDVVWASYRYVVVDELEEKVAGLVVNPWPRVDKRGRLHFGDEEANRHVTVDVGAFAALLDRARHTVTRLPLDSARETALRTRKLVIGDVFAVRVSPRFGRQDADPAKWVRGEVYDISAVARTVAKGQTNAALAGLIERKQLEAIGDDLLEGEDA